MQKLYFSTLVQKVIIIIYLMLLHTRFARAQTSHEVKRHLPTHVEQHFISRESINRFKVTILRLEWYKYHKQLRTNVNIIVEEIICKSYAYN